MVTYGLSLYANTTKIEEFVHLSEVIVAKNVVNVSPAFCLQILHPHADQVMLLLRPDNDCYTAVTFNMSKIRLVSFYFSCRIFSYIKSALQNKLSPLISPKIPVPRWAYKTAPTVLTVYRVYIYIKKTRVYILLNFTKNIIRFIPT